MVTAPPVRVLCVDDHAIVREGVSLIIGLFSDLHVVGLAATGEEAVTEFSKLRPDVTVMDLQLPAMSGVEAIRAIRALDPDARIIVLTVSQGDEDIHMALEAGASAYLLKDTVSSDLVRVIREVHAGRHPRLRPDVRASLMQRAVRPALTRRETQVIELVAQGMRNREIAASLGISDQTAEVHVKRILGKLEAPDRTAAVRVALQRGIIHMR